MLIKIYNRKMAHESVGNNLHKKLNNTTVCVCVCVFLEY